MGRRLKRRELLDLMYETREQLRELERTFPLPSLDLDQDSYLQQQRQHGLLKGRQHGLGEAFRTIILQSRWGPVSQARAHDALLQACNRVWMEHYSEATEYQRFKYDEHTIEALLTLRVGQLDALRAVSRAIAGFPESVRALPDLENPEHARDHAR